MRLVMKAWVPVAVAIACVLMLAPLAPAKGSGILLPVVAQDPTAPGDAERSLFTRGQNLVLQGSHTQAAEVLERFVQAYPNSIITDLALLWLGRAYFQLGRFTEAEELGKRLRAIQDTPFVDIYESELRTARREAAAQQVGRARAESVQPRTQPRSVSSSAPLATERSRFSKTGTATPRSASTGQKKPVTGAPPGNKSARPGITRKPTPQVARRRDAPASGSLKPPSTAANNTRKTPVRPQPRRAASASNNLQERAKTVNRPSRTLAANSTPNPGGRSSKLKTSVPARSSGSQPGARALASNATGLKRGPGKGGATSALSRDTRPKRIATSTSSRTAGSTQPRRKRSADVPGGQGIDSQQSVALSQHAATGGLYSLMEPVVAPEPTNPPGPTSRPAPANTPQQTQLAANSKTLNAKPGEKVYLSFVVRNHGSTRETYELRITSPGAPEAQLYVDSNGDGMHQSDELRVTGAPVVELKNSEVPFLLEVTVPRDAFEGQQYFYTVTVLAFGSGSVIARVTSTLTVSSIRAGLLPAVIRTDQAIQTR